MTNASKHVRSVKEISVSVLEARLHRVARPKDRLWASIRLAERLIDMDIMQPERALRLFAQAERQAKSIGDPRGVAAALRGIGSCELHHSHLETALESFKQALQVAEQTGDSQCEILILREMGRVYLRQSSFESALETFTKCIELAELIGNIQVQASALNYVGAVFVNHGQYHKAIESHYKSLVLLNGSGYRRDQAITYLGMSRPLQLLGQYSEALSINEQARQLFRSVPDSWVEGLCQINAGAIYIEIGNYPLAFSSFFTAARILKRTGDKLNLAIVHGNLMELHLKLGNIAQGRNFGEKTLAIYEEIGNKSGQANILVLLGEYCLNLGEKVQAKRFLKQGIVLSRTIDAKDREAKALILLARSEIHRWKFNRSEKLLQDALAIASGLNHSEYTIAALLELGSLFNKQAQPNQALPFLERAIIMARESRSRPYEQEGHQMLAETLEAIGDLARALEHWKFSSSIKEEMLGIEKQKAITIIQIQAATEKSEKERLLWRKETKFKSQEVERITMDLTVKTEQIRSACSRIKKIIKPLPAKDGHSTRSQLEELLSDLDHSLGDKRAIPNEFQLAYRNTLQKLSKNYPALSLTERKVCVLLHDELSTKQIADMLKMSIRTVEWYRYRIRKRMNLEPWASLTTILAGM